MELVVSIGLALLGLYLLAGVAVAIRLHLGGLRLLDASVDGSSWGFRVLVTPGLVALWPLLLRRYLAATRGAPVPLPYERPLTATQLRVIHRHGTALLAVLAPLALVTILLNREPPAHSAQLIYQNPSDTWRGMSGSDATREIPFGDGDGSLTLMVDMQRRMLELRVHRALPRVPSPQLVVRANDRRQVEPLGPAYGPDIDHAVRSDSRPADAPMQYIYAIPFWAGSGDRVQLVSGVTGAVYAEGVLP